MLYLFSLIYESTCFGGVVTHDKAIFSRVNMLFHRSGTLIASFPGYTMFQSTSASTAFTARSPTSWALTARALSPSVMRP